MPIFPIDQTKAPANIGPIRYEFEDSNGTAAGLSSAMSVLILDEDGAPVRPVNVRNVAKHLTATEKTQLLAIFIRLRGEAAKELIPA